MPADHRSVMHPATAAGTLRSRWSRDQAIVNVRGDPGDGDLLQAWGSAAGLPWPTRPVDCPAGRGHRVVWAGPDDWFVIGPQGSQEDLARAYRSAAGSRHHAVTDVSSGYAVLSLAGQSARDVLAQGCPLDLHPRVFQMGQSAGTHFFKASVWMWRAAEDTFELLVRSSFAGYVEEMLRRCTLECAAVDR